MRSNLEKRQNRNTAKAGCSGDTAFTCQAQDIPFQAPEWVKVLNEYCHEPSAPTLSSDTPETLKITRGELLHAIRHLNSGSAAGPDRIKPWHLKNLSALGINLLLKIVNDSYGSGVVPSELKKELITPLLKASKRSQRNDVASYRPVALTSNV